MKKLFIIIFLVGVIVSVGYLWNAGALPGVPQTDSQIIRSKTRQFFENIQFKAFDLAAKLHNEEDQGKADIPKLIGNLFKIPPEQLDIQNYEVVYSKTDSSGQLGSSLTSITAKVLSMNKVVTKEGKLYWRKENDQWVMKLSDTLEKNKL